jgi:hypothetical protein
MKRKYKTILTIINITFAFIILSIPIFIFLAEFSHYSRIDKSLTYIYSSSTSPPNNELNINSDLGKVDIIYINQPVDYLIRVDVNIEMAGANLEGKSYLDFINIEWENISSPVNFSLTLLVEISNLHKANIDINILLRADKIFDINTSLIEGNVQVTVPMGNTINNLRTNIINGDIYYDLAYCNIEGNITAIVNNGDITLKAYNNYYTRNSKWILINELGDILFDILQNEEMGANITSKGIIKIGIIQVIYKDYSPNIGAQFALYNKTGPYNEVECVWEGFNFISLPSQAGYLFTSYDFPAQNYFNFSLYKPEEGTEGDFLWNLFSIPTEQ